MALSEILETVRSQVHLHVVLNHQAWPGLHWTGYGRFVLVQAGGLERIDLQGPYTWSDGRGQRRDAFELFCILSGLDPSKPTGDAIRAFLALAGITAPVAREPAPPKARTNSSPVPMMPTQGGRKRPADP